MGREIQIEKERDMKNNTKPTNEMISACKAVLMAKAWYATVEPIVSGYERKLLQHYQFRKADKYNNCNDVPGIILEPKKSWLLGDKDFIIYDAECKKERDKAGLKVKHPDNCPLLEAETLVRNTQHTLIDTVAPMLGITLEQVTRSMDTYNKFIDLTMKWIVSYAKAYNINLLDDEGRKS